MTLTGKVSRGSGGDCIRLPFFAPLFSYPARAAKTKRMQTIIQAAMAVMPEALGE